ncbi:SMP-30/gluconolactonase/LRE family protein [Ideonella sp. A 288]|uniref:SMP-30/gluconolactonase/LRE family protein n=1 Tax=Ideonella sp. A 288 TaxID=1962181 RepID=UPI000B4B6681|nr:SMP-30/gluconolactonase/LRE family protein [Ideonella sp. A 288]
METVQGLRLVDLTIEAPDDASARLKQRRSMLRTAGMAAFAASATGQVFAQATDRYAADAPPVRYPEPDVIGLDKRFKYKLGNTPIVRLYRGTMWAEGPAWNGAARCLVWSDIPNNEVLRWSEEDGHVGRRFRYPSGNANGNTFDAQGRQISFCHGTRNVVRYEHSGKVTVLADRANGKELNAPNDGAVHPDGWLFFTDPGYGSLMEYEGNRLPSSASSPQPIQKEAVYRIDAPGQLEKVADEPFKPNGICFSPDYKKCYVADTGISHYPNAKSVIWVYDVDGKRLRNARVFAEMTFNGKVGFADGIRCDEDGNVWAGMGWAGDGFDGVHVFAPDGVRIGWIRMPEIIANVCFGGSKRNRLFMCGSQSLYAVYVETRGGTPT